jgi:hypothetical protein
VPFSPFSLQGGGQGRGKTDNKNLPAVVSRKGKNVYLGGQKFSPAG